MQWAKCGFFGFVSVISCAGIAHVDSMWKAHQALGQTSVFPASSECLYMQFLWQCKILPPLARPSSSSRTKLHWGKWWWFLGRRKAKWLRNEPLLRLEWCCVIPDAKKIFQVLIISISISILVQMCHPRCQEKCWSSASACWYKCVIPDAKKIFQVLVISISISMLIQMCHPRCQENLPSADHQHQYQLIQMCLPSCQEKGDVSRCVCNAIQMVIILWTATSYKKILGGTSCHFPQNPSTLTFHIYIYLHFRSWLGQVFMADNYCKTYSELK